MIQIRFYRTNTNIGSSFKKLASVIALCILFLHPLVSDAQYQNFIQSNASYADKVYLQLDGKVYTPGNVVWFKCIVTDAVSHSTSAKSGVLYVELIGEDEVIREKKLIKIANGIGQGFFNLDKKISEGLYLIRAYTEWNKNFDSDFIFEEYIHVFAPNSEENIAPIIGVTLVNSNNENHLQAYFDPLVLDSNQKNKLKVFMAFDNTKDSLILTKHKDNKYYLDYVIPPESQFATLKMQTTNEFTFAKTIVLDENYLDLQFFPESGELVNGLKSKVGFKAIGANGKGKEIVGDIVDENDTLITTFRSNSLGMGSFILHISDSTKKYFARFIPQSGDEPILLYPLPKIASVGNVLSLVKHHENLLIAASSNYLKNDSVNIQVSCRGVLFFEFKGVLKDGNFTYSIPTASLPEGIIAFSMKVNSTLTVAERLYFNERVDSRLGLSIKADKNVYEKRGLTKLDFQTRDSNGNPISSNLSLLVINKEQIGASQSVRQNILSSFLLSSELKGNIENPGFYFCGDSSRFTDLDALMLTQGWRKYHYARPLEEFVFQAEPRLNLTGFVGGVFSAKKRKRAELTLLTFGKKPSFYTQEADSIGRFNFDLNDEYGQKINVIIQSAKKSGKKVNYTISLDEKKSPIIDFNHVKTVEKVDNIMHEYVEKNIERQKVDDAFPLSSSGDIQIEEVTVTARKLTPHRKKVIERFGEPDDIIDGEDILAKEEKWSYGLYSVLLFNYPEKVRIDRARNGDLYARVNNGEMTLVVIDGIPAKPYEYPLIPNIPPSEVSSFEIIEYAKNFLSLYCEIFPEGCAFGPAWGNVIAIYTHGQKGIYGANKPVGLMHTSIPVFSEPREFYAPKYETTQEKESYKPDLRALIHWDPIVTTDSLGKATLDFYNADITGTMQVIVEAISEQGEIAYKEMEYDVVGKEKEIIIVN